MNDATKTRNPTTTRRAHTVRDAVEMGKAATTLKARNLTMFADGPWVVYDPEDEDRHLTPIPNASGSRITKIDDAGEVASVRIIVDGDPVWAIPDRERAYGGDRYGNVLLDIDF